MRPGTGLSPEGDASSAPRWVSQTFTAGSRVSAHPGGCKGVMNGGTGAIGVGSVNTESGKESPDRLRDRKAGLAIVGTAFLAALCVSWWARGVATPNNVEPPPPATSDGVVGFPAHVDVIRVLETAHEHT